LQEKREFKELRNNVLVNINVAKKEEASVHDNSELLSWKYTFNRLLIHDVNQCNSEKKETK